MNNDFTSPWFSGRAYMLPYDINENKIRELLLHDNRLLVIESSYHYSDEEYPEIVNSHTTSIFTYDVNLENCALPLIESKNL